MAVAYNVGDSDERPWGRYVVTGIGPGYATKQIEVMPGKRLSDQRHKGRTEVWTIDEGYGEIELEDQDGKRVVEVHPGDQVVIPAMTWHRIRNTRHALVLKFREVQVGDCDEADIERRSDDFGRA